MSAAEGPEQHDSIMAELPNPSFAGLTRESSDGDGRIKSGHDDFHARAIFLLDNIPRYMYMVRICSKKEAVIRGTPLLPV